MPKKALTVRFSPSTHALIVREAKLEGVSVSEFLCEAGFARAFWRRIQREGDGDIRRADEVAQRLRFELNGP